MRWLKLSTLLLLALAIDGFQLLVSLSLMVMGAFPGTIGGCAVGAQVAGEFGCAALALVGSIPFVNGILALGFAPIGIALGFAVSISISFTFGSALVLFLQVTGMLDKKAALVAYMSEVIPGVSTLPAWTALVVRCAMKQVKREVVGKAVLGAAVGVGSALVLPNTPVGNAMRRGTLRSVSTTEEKAPRTEPRTSLPMQDVRVPVRQANESYAQTA